MYTPRPIDTSDVELSAEICAVREILARNTHEVWAASRMREGWTLGPRDDVNKKHPCLVPYDELSEIEKDYDRNTSGEALKVLIKLGYKITKE